MASYDYRVPAYTTPPPVDYLTGRPLASPMWWDSEGGTGGDPHGAQSTGTPGNPGTTQSSREMMRDTMSLANSMFGPSVPGYGQIAGTLAGAMIGPGVGAIGAMGDYARGISIGARNQDPVAARIGSQVPSQMLAGYMAQEGALANMNAKDAAIGEGNYGSIGGKDPGYGGLGAGYDGSGNYGGSMDKGPGGPGTNDGAGKGGTGANDPTYAARGGALRLRRPRHFAGGGPIGALRMGSIHTPSIPRGPVGPRLPRDIQTSAQVLRRTAPRRYMTG